MDGFGERLRRLRRERNLTQQDVAEIVGVVPSAVGKYERVANSYPSIDVLLQLADYFHVSLDYLLRGTAEEQHESSTISPEASELLRIYEKLGGGDRLKLLHLAAELDRGQDGQ